VFFNGFGAGNWVNFGIYNAAGNLLVTPTPFDLSAGDNTVYTHTFSGVSLPPGVYYFAQAVTQAGLSSPSLNLTIPSGGTGTVMLELINAVASMAATAANAMDASGNMPATLGALTQITNTAIGIAIPLWTP
jgi:hypothetical protein